MKVVAGLIRQDGKLLLSKRLPNKTFSNYWEIPGGKVEKNESEEDAMKRELDEELGIIVTKLNKVCEYMSGDIHAVIFNICSWRNAPYGKEGQVIHWFEKNEIETILLTPLTFEAITGQ